MFAAMLLLLFQAAGNPAQPPQQPQPRKASIEGVVMSAVSSEPLMRAQVVLQRIQPPNPAAGGTVIITNSTTTSSMQTLPFVTERDGKFEFRNLDPGQYRLRVIRNGYAAQEYGQRTVTTSGVPITLVEGQQLKDVSFKLIAAGVVSGRVRDANGEPVGRVQVSLMRSIYSVTGQRTFSSVGSDTTDDRGEYRVFWAPPGRYIVSVSSNNSSLPIELLVSTTSQYSDRTFPPTYYPGTTDPVRATTIELQPGSEVSGIDFTIAPPKGYRIRGKMLDSTTGKPPRAANITITQRQDQNTNVLLTSNTGTRSTYNEADGTFEIRNVVPGSYWVRGQASTNSADAIDRNLVAQARTNSDLIDLALLGNRGASVQMPIDVGAQDVEGVVLTLSPGINIPVQLSVEGQELMAVANYDRIRVYLRPTTNSGASGNQRVSFTAEGTANIENVSPGEYRLTVNMPMQDYFVKEARSEGMDVLNDAWQITSRTSGTLTVVLSPKAGVIEGNLVDALSKPVGGNLVVLIPDQGRDRTELFKSATTDANGHYSIRGVYPGGYRLYSWEALESNAYFDRDVLAQYESQGKPVRVQEGSKENGDLKLIPVRQ
jgi:protocatechuate 3,4-dioxygenase beta subunit/5-hydroxyisourate hydrolase-like protein (transthyretin family)